MSDDAAFAVRTAREVGPIHPPHAHAHPIHKLHTGPLHSTVAGRTDHLPSNVENGSYILTADHVSHMGENNTVAGFKVLNRMFADAKRRYGGMPYGGGDGGPYGQGSMPYGGHARGGQIDDDGVPVAVAGGEYKLGPAEVAWAGMGDLEAGHRALDGWMQKTRKEHIKTLQNLAPPKRD